MIHACNAWRLFSLKAGMRHSFFYLQRQVEVNVLENGGTWRWAFVIDGHGPGATSKGLTGTAAGGLQEACAAARTVIEQPLMPAGGTRPVALRH